MSRPPRTPLPTVRATVTFRDPATGPARLTAVLVEIGRRLTPTPQTAD